MSANVYKPHLIIYPEDDATKHLAAELKIACQHKGICINQIDIETSCNGYRKTIKEIKLNAHLAKYECRRLLAIIDLDATKNRIDAIRSELKTVFKRDHKKVFILGWSKEIEVLKSKADCAGIGFQRLAEKLFNDALNGCPKEAIWHDDYFAQMHDNCEMARLDKLFASIREWNSQKG
ncbi:hypothetical protein FACS1894139_00260 [Planctomycetales bacterium]|nr:hypothetical protein FACS1894107_01130 [Planctomycetales bacterium]GHT02333.1 hypothetical protein FACS1894139_00260 [Planctomycetales bacterium]